MKKFKAALLALLLVLPNVSVLVRAQTADSEVLIKNGTVMTAVRGTLQNTDILIKNGKIAKIGKNLSVGSGAKVIDATGKFVTPGIIDCHSHSMLDAINEGERTALDNSMILFCSSMMNGGHDATKLPVIVVGGGGGKLKTGRVLDYLGKDNRKMCSLYLSLMDKAGVHLKAFGDSEERLAEI